MIIRGELINSQSGQATTEYILLIAVVVTIFMLVTSGLSRIGAAQMLTTPITGPFAAAYQYGRVDAKGWDNGGSPENHPRADGGTGNFRLFLGSTTAQ